MKDFRYLQQVASLGYAESLCIGCGRCVEVCPHQVFLIEQRKAQIVDFDACMECGACARNCPVGALSVDAGMGCAAGLIAEWLQLQGFKVKPSGGC